MVCVLDLLNLFGVLYIILTEQTSIQAVEMDLLSTELERGLRLSHENLER